MGVCKSRCINKVTLNLNNDFIRYIYLYIRNETFQPSKLNLNVKNDPNFSLINTV